MYVIYALSDPRDNMVRYIGQTQDVYTRFSQHISCKGSDFVRNAWITELRLQNKMVVMQTLQEVSNQGDALEREAYWIKHFHMLGHPITNIQHTPPLATQLTHKSLERGIKRFQGDYTDAIAAWNAGNTTSRKLAQALSTPEHHIGKDKALQLIYEMQERKLI
jgi:predicted GIY-YIG superfamily endonuclease